MLTMPGKLILMALSVVCSVSPGLQAKRSLSWAAEEIKTEGADGRINAEACEAIATPVMAL